MATIIEMPKLSDTMTAGTLVKWLKNEGDAISVGDMLAEVETDKATMELESFEEGVLLKRLVGDGAEVPVGSPVAAIGEKGEKFDESSVKSETPAKDSDKDSKDSDRKQKDEQPSEKESKESDEKGKKETSEKESSSEEAASADQDEGDAEESSKRVKISPLARKLAREHGLPVESLKGSGPGGRIVKADVLAAVEKGGVKTDKPPAPSPEASLPAVSGGAIAEARDIPVSNMRGTIARRLLESKTQIPHYYLEAEVDAGPLLKVRAAINASLKDVPPEKGGAKLSVNDFVMKACAEALRRVPAVNASWEGSSIKQHPAAHVSFAVAIEDGLITPVIFNAHAKTLRHISAETKALAAKAKAKKLKPEEFSGGTFCVSNLGMFGIDRFSAIINPPNAAILAVGGTRKIPVVNARDEIEIGHRMVLTLSCDHRVVDGAMGAEFLSALRELLENPALMLV